MATLFIRMLPLLLPALAGYGLNRRGHLDAAFNRQLSQVLLNLFYPCLIVSSILRFFTWETLLQRWMLPVGTIFILMTGWLVGMALRPLLRRQPIDTRRCFHFSCLLNNYAFLPILMAAALWDEQAVALIVFSTLGSELCVWTVGVHTLRGRGLDRRVFRNLFSMPILALGGSFALLAARDQAARHGWLPAAGSNLEDVLKTLLETCRLVGAATIPASAVICGSRIALLHPGRLLSPLMAGMGLLRLAVIPALAIAGLSLVALPVEARRVLVLIAVQPVAMASVSMAEAYGSDADFAARAVLMTHLGCLATIPLWLAAVL